MPRTDANEMRTRAVASIERSEALPISPAAAARMHPICSTFVHPRLQRGRATRKPSTEEGATQTAITPVFCPPQECGAGDAMRLRVSASEQSLKVINSSSWMLNWKWLTLGLIT